MSSTTIISRQTHRPARGTRARGRRALGRRRLELRVTPVTKRVGDATVRMLAYNGSIPGPVLKVTKARRSSSTIENQGDMDATVHWHGLRLENRFDGTHETQAPINVGERFSAKVAFPDPGAYWYHPHIREDYGQEMGLYGNCSSCRRTPTIGRRPIATCF